jgi:condensin complex subunit 2
VITDCSKEDDGEVDEAFWASAAAAREQGDLDGDRESGLEPLHQGSELKASSFLCSVEENQPNGYDGQFFHDDVDDGADFAEVDDGLLGETPAEGDEDDLWAGAQGLKKAKPETVNYAKRAKRVDVKRLKDNIWKGLKIPSRPSKDEAEETEVSLYR